MQSFFMGVDVSKGYADFIILDDQKQPVVEHFQLDDTQQGHRQLFEVLRQLLVGHPQASLFAAAESTGGYENNWLHSLKRFQQTLNVSVARLNPLGVAHNSKADLKRNTTDKVSARSIAEYLIAHPEKVTYQQDDQWDSLRKQWNFIKTLSKQCTQLLNQLESLLYTANPGLLRFCKDGMPGWVLKLLTQYGTAAHLGRARVSSVAKIPYISKTRAQELVRMAKNSTASATDTVSRELVQAAAKQILHLKKTIAVHQRQMVAHCSLPEVELLKTFNGIGAESAIGLMLEIQTVERFDNVKKLASFCGLHPAFKISGDGSSGFKMSKQGRKEPRRILFMVAMSAIQCNPIIQEVYQRHLSRGKARMDALGVCMHKTLRIIYGMLKHQKPFDPQVDIENRQRAVGKPAGRPAGKNRRFQNYDPAAPVSRRQNKKRLERKEPHCVGDTKFGVIASVPAPVK